MIISRRNLLGSAGGVDWNGDTVFDIQATAGTSYEIYYIVAPSGTTIDWGDGTVTSTDARSHSYASDGTYIVRIGNQATYIRICWSGSVIGSAIRHIYNIGESLSDIKFFCGHANGLLSIVSQSSPRLNTGGSTDDCRAFSNCVSLQSAVFNDYMLEDLTSMYGMFEGCSSLNNLVLGANAGTNVIEFTGFLVNCSSLTNITLPNGFGSSMAARGNPFYRSRLNRIVLPNNAFINYVANGTWEGGVGNNDYVQEFIAGDGFGCNATNLSYFLAGGSPSYEYVSLPSGFGSSATNTDNFLFHYSANPLTNLEMHGSQNGIPISFSLQYCPLTVASVLTVLETLPIVATTQTLTLRSAMRTTYEADAGFMAKKAEVESRGWVIAYA